MRDAAGDLPVDDQGIDDGAAILDHRVIEDFDRPGLGIDGDHGGVGGIGEDAGGDARLVGGGGLDHGLRAGRQPVLAQIGGVADVGEADVAARPENRAVAKLDLAGLALQHVGGDDGDLVAYLAARPGHRAPRHDHGARREGAHAERAERAVAVAHRDAVGVHAKLLAGDLGEGGFQALAVALDAG